jgi:hypothetical protein
VPAAEDDDVARDKVFGQSGLHRHGDRQLQRCRLGAGGRHLGLQMLVEAPSRAPRLQRLLADGMPALHALLARHKGLARWANDVDPLAM